MSCLIRYNDTALSVAFERVRKNTRYCDVKTKKEKRQASINKNELFCSMVEQAVKNGVLFDYVLADSWFGSNENIRFLHEDMEKKIIVGIKSNRLVACQEEGKKGQYQNLSSLNLKDGEKRIVSLKGCSFSAFLIAKVFKNEKE